MGVPTIAIAPDGMETSLVWEWVEKGHLPNIQRLLESGSGGTARIDSMSSARQWTTHFTGVEIDKHGIKGFRRRKSGDEAGTPDVSELINMSDINLKTYPEILSEHGRRVGLINPIIMWPPLELEDGFCISGNLTHPESDNWAFPEAIMSEAEGFDYQIGVKYDNRPYGWMDDDLIQQTDLKTIEEDLFNVLEARIEFSKHALHNYDLDFFYVLFKTIDAFQHCFWAHMNSPGNEFEHTIRDAYVKVDEFIGYTMDNFDDANIFVFSDHGAKARKVPPKFIKSVATFSKRVLPTIPAPAKNLYELLRSNYRGNTGVEEDENSTEVLTGTHSHHAFWACSGPNVESSTIEELDFKDISCIFLALQDIPIPTVYDGSVPEFITNEVSYTDLELEVSRSRPLDSDITDRLYNLGYAEMVENELES